MHTQQGYRFEWPLHNKISGRGWSLLVLLVVFWVIIYQTTLELADVEDGDRPPDAVVAGLEQIAGQLEHAEIGLYEYLLTGEKQYLQPYYLATQLVGDEFRDLQLLTANDQEQRRIIDALEPIITRKLVHLQEAIDLHDHRGTEPALQVALRHKQQDAPHNLRHRIDELRGSGQERAVGDGPPQETVVSITFQETMLSVTFGSLYAVGLVACVGGVLISRDIRRRRRTEEDLRRSRDQLAIVVQGVVDGIVVQDATHRLVYANDAAAHLLGYGAAQELLEAPVLALLSRFEIIDDMGQAYRLTQLPGPQMLRGTSGSETILHLRMVATGEEHWMAIKATPMLDERGSIGGAISFFHDITERVRSYQALEWRVEERTREIQRRHLIAEGLREIMTILISNRPLDEMLDAIIAQGCDLLHADAGTVYRFQALSARLVVEASRRQEGDGALPNSVAVEALVRDTVAQRQPLTRSWPTRTLPPVDAAQVEGTGAAPPDSCYMTVLAVPLMVKDDTYGAITLGSSAVREFSKEEIELAVALGDHAALAIENARLRVQAEQSAVAAERNRLARDLHDAVTQTLFSTSLIADVLPRLWERNREEGQRRLEELRQLTRGAAAEMRALLLELRPATLTEVRLNELLRQLTEAFSSRARVPITLTSEGQGQLPPDVQIALYRIAQEALNNVARHANATAASVRLCYHSDGVELCVSDNGHGFDQTCVALDRLGLVIMRERAEAIGAVLRIDSRAGGGTEVRVTWMTRDA